MQEPVFDSKKIDEIYRGLQPVHSAFDDLNRMWANPTVSDADNKEYNGVILKTDSRWLWNGAWTTRSSEDHVLRLHDELQTMKAHSDVTDNDKELLDYWQDKLGMTDYEYGGSSTALRRYLWDATGNNPDYLDNAQDHPDAWFHTYSDEAGFQYNKDMHDRLNAAFSKKLTEWNNDPRLAELNSTRMRLL